MVERVEVAALYTLPRASIAKPPKLLLVSERVPKTPRVEEAYVEERFVVEAFVAVRFCCTVRLVEMFASPTTSSLAVVEVEVLPMRTELVVVETRMPELLKKVQLISFDPPAPESVPQENLPVVALYRTVSDSVEQLVNESWKKPFETRSAVVVEKPSTWRPIAYTPPANVEVAVLSPRIVVVADLPTAR